MKVGVFITACSKHSRQFNRCRLIIFDKGILISGVLREAPTEPETVLPDFSNKQELLTELLSGLFGLKRFRLRFI